MTKEESKNSRRPTRTLSTSDKVFINRGLGDSMALSTPAFSFKNKINMLSDEFNAVESRRLLKIVDEMREMLHHEKISLPQIVVVGDQSVGKSSVLEALSGVQLPRAQNICTRCPLELRMKSVGPDEKEYATIRCANVPEVVLNDFSQIMLAVNECTLRLAGDQCNVSSSPIYLTVFKRDIREDLTLIDLPGITRNPVTGQSPTIHQDIIKLIEKYIEPETAVVLHVIPSSVDFTTSESIQIAKKYDLKCVRQLIAVSKIDKHDKGIADKLRGIGPGAMILTLGCVAVLNRKQEEIDENVPFDEMRRREEEYFRSPDFDNVPEQFLGGRQLIKRLAAIQQARIRSTLPSIIDELTEQVKQKKLELRQMPPPITSEMDCWAVYTQIIKKYRDEIRARAEGFYMDDTPLPEEVTSTRRDRSAENDVTTADADQASDDRIAYQLYRRQKRCSQRIRKLFSPFFSPEYKRKVVGLLGENAAVALPNFPSFSIIERLYRFEHEKLAEPCEDLIEAFVDYLKDISVEILHEVLEDESSYKDTMIHKLTDIILRSIDESEEQCRRDVEQMLEIEERVYTMNPEYMIKVNQVKRQIQEKKLVPRPATAGVATVASNVTIDGVIIDVSDSSNEEQAAIDVQLALYSYCRIVEKRVTDQVGQLCYHRFMTKCVLALETKFTTAFTSATLLEWMREPFEQVQKRESLKASIQAMGKALLAGKNA